MMKCNQTMREDLVMNPIVLPVQLKVLSCLAILKSCMQAHLSSMQL